MIRSFTDLVAWKEAHKLVLMVYKITKDFPRQETYSLVDQIQRAVVSISSNIAEGFSRKSSKEKTQFFYISLGSLTETQNQLLVARDLGYLKQEGFKDIALHTVYVSKLINGLIKSVKKLNA